MGCGEKLGALNERGKTEEGGGGFINGIGDWGLGGQTSFKEGALAQYVRSNIINIGLSHSLSLSGIYTLYKKEISSCKWS